MKKNVLAALSLMVVAACVATRVDPITVPLAYKANPKNTGLIGGLSCSALSVQVRDARTQQLLGTRVHESKSLKADVTAGSDVASWVGDGVQNVLGQNGLSTAGGGPLLSVTVDSLYTTESVLRRSSYDARITLSAELHGQGGKICWKGAGAGQGGNYGYSGSIPNYQETLNAALDAATANMIMAAGFKDALCHCGD